MYPPRFRFLSSAFLLICALLLASALAGCGSDTTDPPAAGGDQGGALGSGELDPGQLTFTLEAGTTAPDGVTWVPVQLVGRNLQVLADSNQVSLEVAIRNSGTERLFAPGAIYLSRFDPAEVLPLDADAVIALLKDDGPLGEVEYRYDYVEEFGEEGVLEPGETSGYRTWTFSAPTLGAFSFAARSAFGLAPEPARIAGTAFFDNDRDGVYGPGDTPMMMGVVIVATPAGDNVQHWFESELGRYSFPIDRPGLYTLRIDPLIDTFYFAPWYYTTPYPLNVLIPPDGDGNPVSYLGADFGLAYPEWPATDVIQFTEEPVDSLHVMPWSLIEYELEPRQILRVRIGRSGCEAGGPASLWMSGGFMESEPVQANVVFVNEYVSACEAWFEEDLRFDLLPLIGRYLNEYGPGTLQMNLVDYQGDAHVLQIPVYPVD